MAEKEIYSIDPYNKEAWNGNLPNPSQQHPYLTGVDRNVILGNMPRGYNNAKVNYNLNSGEVTITQGDNNRPVPATKQQIASLQRYFANLKNNYNNQQQQPTAIATQKQGGQINYLNLYE